MLQVTCASCGQKYKAKDENAGKSFVCKTCRAPVRVPDVVPEPLVDLEFDEEEEPEADAPAPAPPKSGQGQGPRTNGDPAESVALPPRKSLPPDRPPVQSKSAPETSLPQKLGRPGDPPAEPFSYRFIEFVSWAAILITGLVFGILLLRYLGDLGSDSSETQSYAKSSTLLFPLVAFVSSLISGAFGFVFVSIARNLLLVRHEVNVLRVRLALPRDEKLVFVFPCPGCDTLYRTAVDQIGKPYTCPQCRTRSFVPEPSPELST